MYACPGGQISTGGAVSIVSLARETTVSICPGGHKSRGGLISIMHLCTKCQYLSRGTSRQVVPSVSVRGGGHENRGGPNLDVTPVFLRPCMRFLRPRLCLLHPRLRLLHPTLFTCQHFSHEEQCSSYKFFMGCVTRREGLRRVFPSNSVIIN